MRKLMMKMSMTSDGFVAGPNGETDWLFKTGDTESAAWVCELIRTAGVHAMGRKSFNDMAAYWPTSNLPVAEPMNAVPKAVFTRKGMAGYDLADTTTALKSARQYDAAAGVEPAVELSPAAASWASPRIFTGDLAKGIRELKAESGNPILAHGGAGFMRSLIATGLIDEYYLVTHPVAIGTGMPIFSDLLAPLYLKLVDVKVFPKGVIARTYHPA